MGVILFNRNKIVTLTKVGLEFLPYAIEMLNIHDKSKAAVHKYKNNIEPMFHEIYDSLLNDLKLGKKNSVVYTHHINFINKQRKYYDNNDNYAMEDSNDIIVDYIASMTDDYFVDLYKYLFPDGKYGIYYTPYFS